MTRALLLASIVCVVGCAASVAPAESGIADAPSMDARVDAPAALDSSSVMDAAGSCAPGEQSCAGRCVNTQSSVDHCGGCDVSCRAGANAIASCVAGACRVACAAGFGDCDGVQSNGCEASLVSAMHCGMCGRACTGDTPACNASTGECLRICSAGQSRCGVRCVDRQTDPSNCGACANECPLRANAATLCVDGMCRSRCQPEFGDCDGDASNGCESTLSTASNCGACGRRCAAGQRCCDGVCASACL